MSEHQTSPAETIKQLLRAAGSIAILVSDPIDPDCIASALGLRWMLEQQQKSAVIVSLFRIPHNMEDFPFIDEVRVSDPSSFDFSTYEAIVMVDGGTWSQFLGSGWERLLTKIDRSRLINIDHHIPEDIHAAIPATCLNRQISSTVQLLYEWFIKPHNLQLPPEIAEVLYLALLYDSRNFKNEMHPGEYEFAELLIACGADHERAVDTSVDIREVKFMVWAVEHTEFMAERQLTLLELDAPAQQELARMLGDEWADFNTLYKETILRQVKGYHYGLILHDKCDGSVRLSWRTRNYGDHLSVAEIARRAGFKAGGHRNAGGGTFRGSIADARKRLLDELAHALAAAGRITQPKQP